MKPEEQAALIMRGMIAKATAEEQAQFKAAEDDIRAAVAKHADYGETALTLIALEQAAKQ